MPAEFLSIRSKAVWKRAWCYGAEGQEKSIWQKGESHPRANHW